MTKLSKGLLITIEGNEGCGKSTQIKLLEEALKTKGYSVTVIKEPGSTSIGNKIRELIKDPNNKICSEAELFLFQAARAQLVQEVIKPKLNAGEIILVDRFYDSTWVYQGWARGINLMAVEFTNYLSTTGVELNKTFLIKTPLEVCMTRIHNRGELDRFEKEGIKLLARIEAGYNELAKLYPNRITVINGDKPINEVHAEMLAKTRGLIPAQ